MEEVKLQLSATDPYKILGVAADASLEEIKKSYFLLAKEYSPKVKPDLYKKIRAAYEQAKSGRKQEETSFLLFEAKENHAQFKAITGASYNIAEDILDVEIWRLIQGNQSSTKE